jgi:ankyrin repeat protein
VQTEEWAGSPIARKLTALHCAATAGHPRIAALLMEAGIVIDALVPETRMTALHLAALHQHVDLFKMLIDAGCALDVHITEENYGQVRYTALHTAARFKRTDIAQLLLEGGAAVDARDIDQATPHIAAANGDEEMIELLVR